MTGSPHLVYVLLIFSPGQVSRPAVFGSMRSARKSADLSWHGGEPRRSRTVLDRRRRGRRLRGLPGRRRPLRDHQ